MSKNDGGPAFPRPAFDVNDFTGDGSEGMTLRDWFAGQAVIGLTSAPDMVAIGVVMSEHAIRTEVEAIAAIAFGIADAMLAERERE